MARLATVAPHAVEAATARVLQLFGQAGTEDENRECPLRSFEGRLRRIGEVAGDLAKRRPLKATLDVGVDGNFPAQFADVWKAYLKASGRKWTEEPAVVEVRNHQIVLAWSTGHYRMNRAVLLPSEEYANFEGRVEIDPKLLRKAAAFQVEQVDGGLRLSTLEGKLSTLSIVRAFLDNGYGQRRYKLSSLRCRDLMRRLRSGGVISYTGRASRWSSRNIKQTEVTLTAGKTDRAYVEMLRSRQQAFSARADHVGKYYRDLELWAQGEAEAFAALPEVKEANARQELAEAEENFKYAAAGWTQVARDACYKTDIPSAPFTERPSEYPPTKSVSDGLLRRYRSSCSQVDNAWDRLCTARDAVKEFEPVVPPADVAADATTEEPFALELCA